MKLTTLLKLILKGQVFLALRIFRIGDEFYRASFVNTALSQGIYKKFVDGKIDTGLLQGDYDTEYARKGILAWLEMGVCLGELERSGGEYQIKGRLSRALAKPENSEYKALLEEIVIHHYKYIIETPVMLRKNRRFPLDVSAGELIAESSRVCEPYILDAADKLIPRLGKFRLLEVGCGAGTYIRRACERNPSLTAIGLELQEKVAGLARANIRSWGFADRVTIEHCDVRKYSSNRRFDLVTLHQNIYYFPEEERIGLAKHLMGHLKPGGTLLLTTAAQGGSPCLQALNIWASTTAGFGPLPDPDRLCRQLKEAGFVRVESRRLVPAESLWAFIAVKAKG
jgi:2-polyprenyl-3-methyl-5-hydroxy-6-metoxy-1,4-benzoquinol methylase